MRIIRHQDLDAEQREAADRMLDPYEQSPTERYHYEGRGRLSPGAAAVLVLLVFVTACAVVALLLQIPG